MAPVLQLLRLAPVAGNVAFGVFGESDVMQSIARLATKIAVRSRQADTDAAQSMVDLMRSRVPQDTGRLYNGITWRFEDNAYVVEASAVRTSGSGRQSADYARFVEFGTRAGSRGQASTVVSDAGFFAADEFSTVRRGTPTVRTRRARRGHPGTPARPFFFNTAREILGRRDRAAAVILDELGQDF